MPRLLVLISLFLSLLSSGEIRPAQPITMPLTGTGELSAVQAENLARYGSLREFVPAIQNGNANQLVGVFIDKTLALRVVQQPSSNPGFVSSEPDVATEFSMAAQYGTTALLAHNTAAGEFFDEIADGQKIVLVFGDGDLSYYRVKQIRQFQALSPTSPYSNFIDLSAPDQTLSAEKLFYQIYQSDGDLVFQTCIERDGELSWGRLFIIADPINALRFPEKSARPGNLPLNFN